MSFPRIEFVFAKSSTLNVLVLYIEFIQVLDTPRLCFGANFVYCSTASKQAGKRWNKHRHRFYKKMHDENGPHSPSDGFRILRVNYNISTSSITTISWLRTFGIRIISANTVHLNIMEMVLMSCRIWSSLSKNRTLHITLFCESVANVKFLAIFRERAVAKAVMQPSLSHSRKFPYKKSHFRSRARLPTVSLILFAALGMMQVITQTIQTTERIL